MADATWTTVAGYANRVKFHTATINSSDNDTAVLRVDPRSECSVMIDLGASESVSLNWSNAEDPASANMLGTLSVVADAEEKFKKGVTGFEVTGAVTNASTIRITEVLPE